TNLGCPSRASATAAVPVGWSLSVCKYSVTRPSRDMRSMTLCPRWSAPIALMNETLCPNLLRWAEKLNVAPPKCSSSPTMSQSTSPMLMTFTRNPRSSRLAWGRHREILAQYTLPFAAADLGARLLCCVRLRQRHDFQRTFELIERGGGLESDGSGLSRKQIKIIVRAFDIEIS